MRYLFLLLFTSSTLFSQTGQTSSDKYAWAESGLVMRAEGNAKGEKLAVIPYGAIVQLTGAWGEDLSLEVIPERILDDEEMPSWEMLGQYIGVSYAGQQGYAFSGYINGYDPLASERDSLNGLTKLTKAMVDTLHFLNLSSDHEYGELSVQYPNGITHSTYWDKAGGGGTIVVPNATLAAGYLIAEQWFDLDDFDPNGIAWDNTYLIAKTPDSLTFKQDLLEITIKEYFGVVIIIYDIHC